MSNVREVLLFRGEISLIEDCDFEIVSNCIWSKDSAGYASGRVNKVKIRMHRLIAGAIEGQIVDHINGNRLDNRRCNLRITDRFGNARNSKTRKHNTSGFRGVTLCRSTGKWRAEIRVNGKGKKLGRFATKEEAARVYDAAAKTFHGEFAVTNFGEA